MAPNYYPKVADAYAFADAHGLGTEADNIRHIPIHSTFNRPHVVRKAYLVELFESRGLLNEFVAQYWAGRHTPAGDRVYASYRDQRLLNEKLLVEGDPVIEEEALIGETREQQEELDATTFALEAQLRDFIIENLSHIPVNGNRLKFFTDQSGRDGREYPTDVGPIDILAQEESGDFVVFELKLERGPDRALGQLARYMGWVKLHLAGEHAVKGVVVARSIDQRLRYAVCVFPNVSLLEYVVEFRLNDVGQMTSDSQPNKALAPTARDVV
jgi:hypothetical protein